MINRTVVIVLFCAVLMVTVLASAGERMVLQAQPKAAAAPADLCDVFYVCSYWHELSPNYCTIWHVVYCGPAIESSTGPNDLEKAFVGRELTLENRSEVRRVKVQRVAPQYHLASGAVVEPQGEWDPRDAAGEEWREVRPLGKQSVRIANWEDSNRDGVVGAGDRVVFGNGRASRIKAVRLGVHVDVVETTPQK